MTMKNDFTIKDIKFDVKFFSRDIDILLNLSSLQKTFKEIKLKF